jgi:hypothetical protein
LTIHPSNLSIVATDKFSVFMIFLNCPEATIDLLCKSAALEVESRTRGS